MCFRSITPRASRSEEERIDLVLNMKYIIKFVTIYSFDVKFPDSSPTPYFYFSVSCSCSWSASNFPELVRPGIGWSSSRSRKNPPSPTLPLLSQFGSVCVPALREFASRGSRSCIDNLLIPVHDLFFHRLVENIDLCRSKLSRADALLKKHVQLRECPSARLGQPEVGVDDAQEADSALVRRCLSALKPHTNNSAWSLLSILPRKIPCSCPSPTPWG